MSVRSRTITSRSLAFLVGLACSLLAWSAPDSISTEISAHGIDLAGIDHSIVPGDDFFKYANGTWLKNTPIPDDRAAYGAGTIVYDLTSERTAELIKQAASGGTSSGSEAQKIGDFYASYMDEAGIEAAGLTPLQPTLDRIAALSDRQGLSGFLGSTLRADVDVLNATNLYTDNLFGLWVAQDLNDPSRYVPFLLQGGLGMPDRAYYLDAAPRMAEIRAKYQAHITAVLKLATVSDSEAKAARVFDLERRIAEVHWNRTDTGDVRKGNNHWSRQDFETRAPGLD